MNTKKIEGYNAYTITEDGTVYSLKGLKPRKLKPQRATQSKKGYFQVRLYDGSGKLGRLNYIHRLVWETFRGNIPKGLEIDHKDGDTTNNSLTNLQVLTHRGNGIKATKDNYGVYLREHRDELCKDYETLGSFKKVAKKWGVSYPAVWRVIRNRTHYFDRETGKYGTRVYDENLKDKWTLN